MRISLIVGLGLPFFMGASALAAPVTVSLSASKDNTLYEDPNGTLSDGIGPHFFAGRTSQGSNSIRRGLLAFDLSSIPAGATITNVTLTLNMSKTSAASATVALHKVLRDWGEGTSNAGEPGGSGASATTNDATWKHTFFNTQTWSNLGGDFVSSESAATTINQFGPATLSGSGMLADVQAWRVAPASNFGWELVGDENIGGTALRFDSRENPDSSVRPVLSVTYNVPEPAALGLLALAPLLARRQRRA
jgi:hypothetical protein